MNFNIRDTWSARSRIECEYVSNAIKTISQRLDRLWRRLRSLSAWVALVAGVNSLIIVALVRSEYHYSGFSTPKPPEWMLLWQHCGFQATFLASVISFPKWQSLAGLGILLFIVLSLYGA